MITKKKFESFDISYSKGDVFVRGSVTVRVEDKKINELNVTVYKSDPDSSNDSYSARCGVIYYNEVGNTMDGNQFSKAMNISVSEDLNEETCLEIINEVKDDVLSNKEKVVLLDAE